MVEVPLASVVESLVHVLTWDQTILAPNTSAGTHRLVVAEAKKGILNAILIISYLLVESDVRKDSCALLHVAARCPVLAKMSAQALS
jgi:hypothetical protein